MTAPASPPTPVFICGVGRSGTTLLASLLDSHPDLAVLPGQTHCFREMFLSRWASKLILSSAELADAEWPKRVLVRRPIDSFSLQGAARCRSTLEHWLEQFPNPPQACRDRLSHIAENLYVRGNWWDCFLTLYECAANQDLRTKKYWVEKTPDNERFLFLSERVFCSTTRYLHIVRDPRAVLASRLQWDGTDVEPRRHAIATYCHGWARSAHQGLQNLKLYRDRYRVLRYEDLVEDPRGTMTGIARFLDIEATESLLTPTRVGNAHPMNSSYQDYRGATPGIVQTQVARFREILAPEEIAAIESMLGRQMSALRYRELRETKPSDSRAPLRHHPLGSFAWKRRIKLWRMSRLQKRFRDVTIPLLGEHHG